MEPFAQLSETMFGSSARIARGTAFAHYQEELFDHLFRYRGRSSDTIGSDDVRALQRHLEEWFDGRAATRTIFIPCMITPAASSRIDIGPVAFLYIDDVRSGAFYPRDGTPWHADFDGLLKQMVEEQAHWLAVVEIEDCDQDRAHELAALSVDLAIVAFQLAEPYLDTRTMSRLAVRRGPNVRRQLSLSNGRFAGGFSNMHSGLSIGKGYLGHIVSQKPRLFDAVGNRVGAFVAGTADLGGLERAWCDAAYWLHEGLAEPVDSIAVAKLETSLEVLLHAESTRGSTRRILLALDTFFGLASEDPISEHASTTAKQFAAAFVRDRSEVLHGTASTLNARLSASRDSLEHVAITLIRAFAMELDGYRTSTAPSDDIDAFLTWIKACRESASSIA